MSEVAAIVSVENKVGHITLNRPDRLNALNAEMITIVKSTLSEWAMDPEIGCVVVTGAGRAFCAGGDLDWMRAQMAADSETRAKEGRRLANMLFALNTLSKPLIGRIQGQAFGGGIGMACVCDVAVGVDTAKFCLT